MNELYTYLLNVKPTNINQVNFFFKLLTIASFNLLYRLCYYLSSLKEDKVTESVYKFTQLALNVSTR